MWMSAMDVIRTWGRLFVVITAGLTMVCRGEICRVFWSYLDSDSFQVEFETVRMNGSGPIPYDLQATFSWDYPAEKDYDAFVVELERGDEDTKSMNCGLDDEYDKTTENSVSYRHLLHGYRYKFKVALYNATTKMRSFWRYNEKTAPDCYEETQDRIFCASRSILTVGVPVEVQITDITKYVADKDTVVAHVTWQRPVQVNGTLASFFLSVRSPHANIYTDILTVSPSAASSQNSQFTSDIPGIDEGALCTVKIYGFVKKPWIRSASFIGPPVSFAFNATPTRYIRDATPLRDFLDELRSRTLWPWPKSSEPKSTPYLPMSTADSVPTIEARTASTAASSDTTPQPSTSPNNTLDNSALNPQLKTEILAGVTAFILACLTAILIVRQRLHRLQASDKTIFIRYPDNSIIERTPTPKVKRLPHSGTERDPTFDDKEFDRSLLKIEGELGAGQFGLVQKAFALGLHGLKEYVPVAVKSLKANATASMKEDFLSEMKLMIDLGSHPNILPILGCCTLDEPFYLLTEFMKYGDLLHFLWKCRELKYSEEDSIYNLTAANQLQIAHQLSRGMEYLSKTRYYHGDLAARNVLVGEGLEVKISDFGLADDIYQSGYKRLAPDKKRPVKWVSLETNTTGRCTIQSDVWSFGIVLYEIYTLGGIPYPGMDGREIVAKLQEGYRMPQPEECPDEIYKIMRSCWQARPCDRLSFTSLFKQLDDMLLVQSDYLATEVGEAEAQTSPSFDKSATSGQCDDDDENRLIGDRNKEALGERVGEGGTETEGKKADAREESVELVVERDYDESDEKEGRRINGKEGHGEEEEGKEEEEEEEVTDKEDEAGQGSWEHVKYV